MKQETVAVRIPAKIKAYYERQARRQDRKLSEVLRRALVKQATPSKRKRKTSQ